MIANERLPLPKLDGIYFLSPTDENVQRIMADFDNPDEPMYRAAHLFFTASTLSFVFFTVLSTSLMVLLTQR